MFKDLVMQNRSYRGYDQSRVVTREELMDLVDHARLTPSSINAQPFRYCLVYQPEMVAKVQPLTKWAGSLSEIQLPHEGKCPTAFIVICQDMTLGQAVARFQKDVGIVAQTMLLSAAEKGLGGCMIGNFSPASVKEALGLGDDVAPVLLLALGKPDETIVLTQAKMGESIKYYRDENDVHYVPKYNLEDILL